MVTYSIGGRQGGMGGQVSNIIGSSNISLPFSKTCPSQAEEPDVIVKAIMISSNI
jgi:hypothetical protein